ncbi:BMP family lipoprotein [Lysinibacillus piscis]|uniref:BMP family ABC transporter substrate-binding protein n=1 Tax=Lysinibacillus piscis TaxID=2518931 RepID=A0ABQ5NFU0_9BACI|nr:BMP family ABC transporter substrate-binding protein [Lysinibacillus sp. KH24]GLC87234.1 BMP family ABC transporter substrate-binding protein [Lysinibacillus sp. KH24]
MKKQMVILCMVLSLLLASCAPVSKEQNVTPVKDRFKVGIMLPDVGLGDQSFADMGFNGLVTARDELGIVFDYRELGQEASYEKGFLELVAEGNDLIFAVGYTLIEDLEKVAKANPNQQFVLVDAESDVPNIHSITFKENEGSYLAGALAALTTKTNKVAFLGGMVDPVIEKFEKGFIEGAKSITPSIDVLVAYADTYGDDKVGKAMAADFIAQGADVLYAAAGYTGVGLLQQAQESGVYAIGVDTDQYLVAEKAVISSMLKNIDVAIYEFVKNYVDNKPTAQQRVALGMKEHAMSLAPIRVVNNADVIEEQLKTIMQQQFGQ